MHCRHCGDGHVEEFCQVCGNVKEFCQVCGNVEEFCQVCGQYEDVCQVCKIKTEKYEERAKSKRNLVDSPAPKVETTDLPKKTISCKHLEDVCEKCLKKVEISFCPKKGLKKVEKIVCPKKGLKVETIYFPKKCLEKVQTSTEEKEEEDSNPPFREIIRDEKRKKILFDSALLGVVGFISYYNAKYFFKYFFKTFDYGVSLVKDILKTLSTDTPTE